MNVGGRINQDSISDRQTGPSRHSLTSRARMAIKMLFGALITWTHSIVIRCATQNTEFEMKPSNIHSEGTWKEPGNCFQRRCDSDEGSRRYAK